MNASFRALTTDVALDIADDLPSAALAAALVSTYAPAIGEPALRYALSPDRCTRDGHVAFESVEPLDLVPLFELDLYGQLVARARPGWVMHAAAVEVDDSIIVFAGPSGAGKTTLALELVARGHRLMTEEIVWIAGDASVCGLSRPLHVLPGEEPAQSTGWRRLEYPLRTSKRHSNMLVLPPPSVFRHGVGRLRALVRLTHGPDREAGLTRLSAAEAFQRFWTPTLRPDQAGMVVAAEILRSTPAFRLASTTLAESLTALEDLLARK
jgi:hypothetical protein